MLTREEALERGCTCYWTPGTGQAGSYPLDEIRRDVTGQPVRTPTDAPCPVHGPR